MDHGHCSQHVASRSGPGHGHYQNSSSICQLRNRNDPSGETILQVLTTLQYLAEGDPKSPPPGHITQCVQSIMQPLQ